MSYRNSTTRFHGGSSGGVARRVPTVRRSAGAVSRDTLQPVSSWQNSRGPSRASWGGATGEGGDSFGSGGRSRSVMPLLQLGSLGGRASVGGGSGANHHSTTDTLNAAASLVSALLQQNQQQSTAGYGGGGRYDRSSAMTGYMSNPAPLTGRSNSLGGFRAADRDNGFRRSSTTYRAHDSVTKFGGRRDTGTLMSGRNRGSLGTGERGVRGGRTTHGTGWNRHQQQKSASGGAANNARRHSTDRPALAKNSIKKNEQRKKKESPAKTSNKPASKSTNAAGKADSNQTEKVEAKEGVVADDLQESSTNTETVAKSDDKTTGTTVDCDDDAGRNQNNVDDDEVQILSETDSTQQNTAAAEVKQESDGKAASDSAATAANTTSATGTNNAGDNKQRSRISSEFLSCYVCDVLNMTSEAAFVDHVRGWKHQQMMELMEQRLEAQAKLIRIEIQVASKRQEMENRRRVSKGVGDRRQSRDFTFCSMCAVRVYGCDLMHHRANDALHIKLKSFLHPRCCGIRFDTPVLHERHLLSFSHFRRMQEQAKEMSENDAMTIADGAEASLPPATAAASGDEVDQNGDKSSDAAAATDVPIPLVYDEQTCVGEERGRHFAGVFCEVCHVATTVDEWPQHCRSRLHFTRYSSVRRVEAKAQIKSATEEQAQQEQQQEAAAPEEDGEAATVAEDGDKVTAGDVEDGDKETAGDVEDGDKETAGDVEDGDKETAGDVEDGDGDEGKAEVKQQTVTDGEEQGEHEVAMVDESGEPAVRGIKREVAMVDESGEPAVRGIKREVDDNDVSDESQRKKVAVLDADGGGKTRENGAGDAPAVVASETSGSGVIGADELAAAAAAADDVEPSLDQVLAAAESDLAAVPSAITETLKPAAVVVVRARGTPRTRGSPRQGVARRSRGRGRR